MIKHNSIEELLKQTTRSSKQIKADEDKLRIERTSARYIETQTRIREIEEKISRLTLERDNLVRKQQSRVRFLEEQQEK